MTHNEFSSWLHDYGRAWETRDAHAAAALFGEDSAYNETPFVEPMRGRAEIMAYWLHVVDSQEQIRFGYEIMSVAQEKGIAHWWVSFTRVRERTKVYLDGIFIITLNSTRLCTTLREWWQRKQTATDQTVELSPNIRRSSPLRPD